MRWETGKSAVEAPDDLAPEEPLEIRVDNHPVSITMRSPGNDDELAVGFLVSEGIIREREQVIRTQHYPRNTENNVINVFLTHEIDLARLTRHVFASSSCGLCGKATIDAVQQQFPKIETSFTIRASTLPQMAEKQRTTQQQFSKTGGLHAASLFNTKGNLIVTREDVGRHNAVDKTIGFGVLNKIAASDKQILLVSGRASFEIMQKALSAGIGLVAAVSAPSNLAVQFAEENGQTLVGFLRDGRFNVYSHPERIIFD